METLKMRRLYGMIWLAAAVTAIGTACGAFRVDVVGNAMAPTLKDGDSAIATRDVATLQRGDIVGFKSPNDESKSFVQRIVGLPGDSIEVREGQVILNGNPLQEPYVAAENRSNDSWGPATVAPGTYFVMGDNRRDSSDSRSWGSVRREAIWAKVFNP